MIAWMRQGLRWLTITALVLSVGCGGDRERGAEASERDAGGRTDAGGPADRGTIFAYVWHQMDAPPLVPGGVDHLLVRAGEIGQVDGAGVSRLLPQALEHCPETTPVTLVYRVRQSLNRVFEAEPARVREALVEAIDQDRARLAALPRACPGVQIDFDCPTRLLRAYAAFLADLRSERPGPLSITTLPTWLGSPDLDAVAAQCDWLVAQTYALTLPDRVEALPRIASAERIREWDDAYDRLARRTGTPYVLGLPTYGQVLVFDESGRRRAIAADLDPTDAYAASDLRPAGPPERDGLHVQHRFETDAGGTVRITEISAEGLAAALALVDGRHAGGRNGIALFRLARAEDDLALPASSIEAVLAGSSLVPRVVAGLARDSSPAHDGWRLTITNAGAAAALGMDAPAAELSVRPARRAFAHVPLGEPYLVSRRRGAEKVGSGDACDRMAFWVPYLGPGRSVTVPVIRADGAVIELMAPAPGKPGKGAS